VVEQEEIKRLHKEIDAFTHKFYWNKAIRGMLLFTSVLLSSYLLFTTLAFFFALNAWIKFSFLVLFTLINGLSIIGWVLIPILKSVGILPTLSRIQASQLIGRFFPEIADRLTNTLQLMEASQSAPENIELLTASVAQKTKQLRLFRFSNAVDFRVNTKYIKYVLPALLTLFFVLIFIPGILTQGAQLILDYDKKMVPFTFELLQGNEAYEEDSDILIRVKLKGKRLPEKVYIVSDQGKFLMKRITKNEYQTTLKKIKTPGTFYFTANDEKSSSYAYTITGKNVFGKVNVTVKYPAYLGKPTEHLVNIGDLTVPEGTVIEWFGQTKNTDKINVYSGNNRFQFNGEAYKFSHKALIDTKVKVLITNKYSKKKDSTFHHVTVVKDAFPTIVVNETSDSLKESIRYFSGEISDDYGIQNLVFSYKLIRKGAVIKTKNLPVSFQKGTKSKFEYAVDFLKENVELEDKIEYHFMVSDNDGVNGSKTTKSYTGEFILPNLEQLNENRTEQQQETRDELENVLNRTQQFEKNIEKLKKDINNSKSSDWLKKEQINQLQEERNSLEKELNQIKEKLDNQTREKDQLSPMDKALLEKQELIEKLLENVMDEELKKLLEEIEKLFNQQENKALQKEMNQLDNAAEQMQKQLDRTLEMLKKLQLNERIDDLEKELKENAANQELLKEKMDKDLLSKEEALKEQQAIEDRFKNIQEKLEEIKKDNEKLENPMDLGGTEALEESIQKELSEAEENIKEGKKNKSKENQQKASDQMDQLSDMLNSKQESSNKQQQEEDMDMVREILEKLMHLSFEEEKLLTQVNRLNTNDPKFKGVAREQVKINSKTVMVRDSLLALAKRQPNIATFIDKELNDIRFSEQQALESIASNDKAGVVKNQQSTMTSFNNLALLLNEALQQMQSQMQMQMEGSGSCSKPGKGKPKSGKNMSSGDMKEMLKKQLEQMKKGSNPGGSKPGEKPGQGTKPGGQGKEGLGLSNQEIAKMAAQQSAIRQRLEQLKNELNKDGQGKGNQLNPLLDELKKQEKEIINKNFTNEMVERQQEILTRLLESEKALMERGFEDQRQSKSGVDKSKSNLIELKEYTKIKQKQIEMLRVVDPSFSTYYKQKAATYFNIVD
jgi:flagellar biosynthesis GTPase FlhF